MMRPFLLLLMCCIFSAAGAQDSLHVEWKAEAHQVSAKKYSLRFTGKVKEGWRLYAKANPAEGLFGLVIAYPDSSIRQELLYTVSCSY